MILRWFLEAPGILQAIQSISKIRSTNVFVSKVAVASGSRIDHAPIYNGHTVTYRQMHKQLCFFSNVALTLRFVVEGGAGRRGQGAAPTCGCASVFFWYPG